MGGKKEIRWARYFPTGQNESRKNLIDLYSLATNGLQPQSCGEEELLDIDYVTRQFFGEIGGDIPETYQQNKSLRQ